MRALVLLLTLTLGGCTARWQSALEPAGPQADLIASLWWGFLVVTGVVWVTTLGFLVYAVVHGRRRTRPAVDPETTRKQKRAVGVAVIITVLILTGIAVSDFVTGRRLAALASTPPHALTIRLIGHQWWWEIQYEDSTASRRLATANELHIPIGRPVLLRVTSSDVIHSLWIPNLHGKRDLVPGYESSFWIRADRPGVYRGQCAEFCGHQHAKMGLLVIAESPERFAQWYEAQLAPGIPPADSIAARGLEVFLGGPCVMCHAIRGTPAGAHLGPDLTHLASQQTLAAASIPNTSGHLAAWILDAQSIKPGVRMPPNRLPAADLTALLHYLRSLK